jgi:predicted DNA-binding ribbon-helix-helix protein
MKALIVVSCSWGCGEWQHTSDNQIEVSHPGLSEYLSKEFNVVNLSRGGNSNWQICYTLHNYLNNSNFYDNFEILVIQTDPTRTLLCEKYIDIAPVIESANNLEALYISLIELFYWKLAHIADTFNVKIHLAGGLYDIQKNILNNQSFSKLNVACESWIKLLAPEYTLQKVCVQLDSKLLSLLKLYKRFDLLDEAIKTNDRQFLIYQSLLESELFGPSYGDFHPSRDGHKIFSDYILKYFKDENA